MMCMQTVIVEVKQITGNGRRALSYQWQMKNVTSQMSALLAKESGRTLSFPSKLLTSEAAVAVTACNFVNECTTSEDVLLQPVTAAATLSLSLGGSLGLRTLTPSMAVRLRALPELTRCNSSLTVVPNDAQYNWFLDHIFVTNDDSYRIPAFTYEAGDSVEVRVEVNYKDPSSSQHLSATTEETLVYVAEKLVTTVDAISRSIASDAAVVLDASQSKNPNVKDGSVTHEWTCFNETSQNN
ncbi:unnamed protein product [Cylicostephanus goldi]|uniref:PKD/REJ-like domain-containing protein n=1 Tax=Cylicostephanus goldi TaxID=71465 RepID=A0A3P6QZ55_CYLGO|nr:unnamed protein product [Cylicostephanus goldi]